MVALLAKWGRLEVQGRAGEDVGGPHGLPWGHEGRAGAVWELGQGVPRGVGFGRRLPWRDGWRVVRVLGQDLAEERERERAR